MRDYVLPSLPLVRILFSATALVGAFLLFLVEPMFARMLLPFLGGAPAVWNTCLVFYQCALLAGYMYAHGVSRQSPRRQVGLQALLLLLGAIALPIAIHGPGTPPASSNPIGWVLAILLLSLGLPFTVLATTGPLLQRWFTLSRRSADESPYSLFAASNIGSFVALFGYPIVVEPNLQLHTQSVWWTGGYATYAVLLMACAVLTWRANGAGAHLISRPAPLSPAPAAPERRAKRATRDTAGPAVAAAPEDDVWADRLRWLGLAAVPASLMMSVTTFISTDVASIPLLWMMPLAIYLLTFVLAFAERRWYPARLVTWLFPVAVVLIVGLVIAPPVFPLPMIALHLSCFAIIALACHAELARQRPDTTRLTEFYLWLSAGGAIGGLLNALVAPLVFVNPFEYPLAALSACLLFPRLGSDTLPQTRTRTALGLVLTVLPVLLVVAMLSGVQRFNAQIPNDTFTRYALIVGPPLAAAFLSRRRPLHMGIALAMVAVAGGFIRFDNRVPIHLERSFFGVHRVVFSGRERVLLSGTTNHGAQSVNAALKCEPLTYYSRGGPIGQLFDSLKGGAKLSHIGVVGLGTASMAAYAAPDQQWTFFEINPAVERLARDPEYFTYLRDCAPQAKVVIGDARLMLASQPAETFNVLVLDAFSSDSIPVHLMTREAMQLYVRKLAPGGLLAVHISNRYLELGPVVGATARAAGLTSIVQLHVPTSEQLAVSSEISLSRWVLMARNERDFGSLPNSGQWHTLDDETGPVWTDDYSNVVGVMRW